MSGLKNGRAGHALTHTHRNYKYRRLSSVEKGSVNYISGGEDEEEIFNSTAMELKAVKGKAKKSTASPVRFVSEYEQLVQYSIKSGDTLRSVSLKYRIPLSELKRVNNIIQDNEFFALNTVKIPVKPNSLLAEMLDKEEKEEGARGGGEPSVSNARSALLGTRRVGSCSEYESDSEMHVGYISIDRILRDTRTKKEAKRFLDTMQDDLAKIRAKTNTYKGSLDEAAAALNDLRFRPLEPSGSNYSGADWGLNWWKILLIGIVILLGIPAVYIYIYFYFNNGGS